MDFEPHSPLNFPDSQLALLPLKQQLKEFEAWQVECFIANKEIDKIVMLRARFIDELLSRLWSKFKLKESYDLSLIAVGGYGRGELHPKSDIDLLILSDHGFSPESEEKISVLLLLLWDLNLDIGHSVRTLKDCDEQGRADITVATSMIEARFIEGNKDTFEKLVTLVNKSDFWPSDQFFILKKEEQQQRHLNCRGDGYSLEPDLKNGSGGLRDIQTIAWISKRHFNANSMLELTTYGYLTQAEYRELTDCRTLLWKLRFALHSVTNRPDNRLLFDFQSDVARLINSQASLPPESQLNNAPTPHPNQLIEDMMKGYYKTIHHVRELNQMLLHYFDDAILGNGLNDIESIDDHFQLRNKMIEAKKHAIFKDHPESILQLFLHAANDERIEGISPPTLRELREVRRCLTQWLQNIPECRTVFMKIIKHSQGMGRAFSLMHAHGILGAYIPQWSRIVGQMQFDLFHAYTVDQHTHKLVKFIYNYPNTKDIHPLAHKVCKEISQPELLFLAAIFHDIAKGQQGDHSTLGAVDAREFCQLHGLNQYDSDLVAWLVEQHLTMSVTAQRRDISDQAVILKFATTVQNIDRLRLLFCLTVADICATNEDAWNGWKGTLIRELYQSTFKLLRRGFENDPGMKDRMRGRKAKVLGLLEETGLSKADIKPIWRNFKLNYFLRYHSVQIVWHIQHLLTHHDRSKPLVIFSNDNARGATEIFVYHKDSPFLFSSVAAEISNKKLSIHDAKILSSRDNYSLTTFTVLGQDGEYVDIDIMQRLKLAIETALVNPQDINLLNHRLTRVKRHFKFEPMVTFLPSKQNKTLIEVVAFDAPGMLANIGHVFRKQRLMLDIAKITTIGERAEDLFILSTLNGEALNKQEEEALKAGLIKELSPSN